MRIEKSVLSTHGSLLGRRDFLKVGLSTAALSMLPEKLFASQPEGLNLDALYKVVPVGNRQKPIVMIWLEGGMSHIDTFSPISTAPDSIRGPYRTIQTSATGVRISEKLPLTARQMHKVALMRNIKHADANHSTATSVMFSGSSRVSTSGRDSHYDSFSVRLSKHLGESNVGYVTINADYNNPSLYPGVGQSAGLHVRQNPDTNNSGNIPFPSPFGADFDRQRHRARTSLLQQVNNLNATNSATARWDELSQRANSMLDGDLNGAFDLQAVSLKEREKYSRTAFGNAALIAKRMVEAGAPFVLVNKFGWDNHSQIKNELDSSLPVLDRVIASLLEDIGNRAIIVVGTEFGRTPVINGSQGRDHWPQSSFLLIGGAGITPRMIGRLDNRGEITGEDGIYQGELMGPTIAKAAGYEFVEERAGVLTTNKMPYYPVFS